MGYKKRVTSWIVTLFYCFIMGVNILFVNDNIIVVYCK